VYTALEGNAFIVDSAIAKVPVEEVCSDPPSATLDPSARIWYLWDVAFEVDTTLVMRLSAGTAGEVRE
jgi:hypothetical protein